MGSQTAVRAGRAFVEFFLRDNTDAGLKRIETKMRQAGSRMESAFTAATGVGVPTAGIALAVNDFAKLDDVLRLTSAATLGGERDFRRLRDNAMAMGKASAFTTMEFGQLQLVLGRAGVSAQEMTRDAGRLTKQMEVLARVTGTELPEAGEGLMGTIKGWGDSTTDATKHVGQMIGTLNSGMMVLDDYVMAFKQFGAVAKDNNQSLSEMNTILAVLANRNRRGTEAGTHLKRFFVEMSKLDVQEHMQKYGIAVADADGNMRSAYKIMRQMNAAMAGAGGLEATRFFTEAVGDRAVTTIKMIANTTESEFQKIQRQVKNAANAEEAYAQVTQSLNDKLLKMWSAIRAVGFAIGKTLAPAVELVAIAVKFLAGWLEFVIDNSWIFGTVVLSLIPLLFTLLAATTAYWGAMRTLIAVKAVYIALLKTEYAHTLKLLALRIAKWYKAAAAAQALYAASTTMLLTVLVSVGRALWAFVTHPLFLFIAGLTLAVYGIRKVASGLSGMKDAIAEAYGDYDKDMFEEDAADEAVKRITDNTYSSFKDLNRRLAKLARTGLVPGGEPEKEFKRLIKWRKEAIAAGQNAALEMAPAEKAEQYIRDMNKRGQGTVFGTFSGRELSRAGLGSDPVTDRLDDIITALDKLLKKEPVEVDER